jgi:hypothetical protein
LNRSTFHVAAIALLAACLAVGCASLGHRAPDDAPDAKELARIEAMLDQARSLEREGRFAEAAAAYEAAYRIRPAPTIVELDARPLERAAVCWLAAGDEQLFVAAIDEVWRVASEFERRSLRPGTRALVALADRFTRSEPRIPHHTLPPAVRRLIDADPVPTWELRAAFDTPAREGR